MIDVIFSPPSLHLPPPLLIATIDAISLPFIRLLFMPRMLYRRQRDYAMPRF